MATDGLAREVSGPLLANFARLLGLGGRPNGVLEMLAKRLSAHEDLAGIGEALQALRALAPPLEEMVTAGDLLGDEVADFCREVQRYGDAGRTSVRLTREARESDEFVPVAEAGQAFIEHATEGYQLLLHFAAMLAEIPENSRTELEGIGTDAAALASRLGELLRSSPTLPRWPTRPRTPFNRSPMSGLLTGRPSRAARATDRCHPAAGSP